MAEIRYVEGLYRMWDDIGKAHPGLFIDNCASGGRRIDLETCLRSITLWRTDGVIEPFIKFDYDQTAIQNQVTSAGLNRYLPYSSSGSIGAKPYYFGSGFNYGVPLAEQPREDERELLRQSIAEGKRLRAFWLGNFYPLSRVTMSPRDWCVLQYHRPKEQDGIVVAFRRQKSPDRIFACDLHGIDPAADYLVTQSRTYEPSKPVPMKGLSIKPLIIEIDGRPGSVIVEYRKK
jgi:alpha-galactosidase